jgi:hypothetical protein
MLANRPGVAGMACRRAFSRRILTSMSTQLSLEGTEPAQTTAAAELADQFAELPPGQQTVEIRVG